MKSHNLPQPDEHMPTRLAQNLGQCPHCSTCLSGKTEWTQHLRLGWLLYAPKWVLSNLPPDEVTQPTSTRWTHAHQTGPESRTMPSLFNLSLLQQDWPDRICQWGGGGLLWFSWVSLAQASLCLTVAAAQTWSSHFVGASWGYRMPCVLLCVDANFESPGGLRARGIHTCCTRMYISSWNFESWEIATEIWRQFRLIQHKFYLMYFFFRISIYSYDNCIDDQITCGFVLFVFQTS